MEPARSRSALSRLLALSVMVAGIAAATGSEAVLRLLLPLQSAMTASLLSEFEVRSLELSRTADSLQIVMSATSREYLVLRGVVAPPGLTVDVRTPARQSQRHAALAAAAAVLSARAGRWSPRRGLLAVLLAAALGLALVPVTMAGQVWALALDSLAEPSAQALLAAASRILLHGGDVAAMLLLAMVLSAHGRD